MFYTCVWSARDLSSSLVACAAEAAKEELVTDDGLLYAATKKRTKVLKSAEVHRRNREAEYRLKYP